MDADNGNVQAKGPGKKINIIMFFLLVVVVIVMAFYMYLMSNDNALESIISLRETIAEIITSKPVTIDGQDIIVEISFDSKQHPVFGVYKDILVKCTLNSIKGINKKNEEVWEKDVTISNALIKTNGSELLIADIGGKNVYVISGSKIKWQETVDGEIINADINETGYVTILQEITGYKNKVTVFDPMGIEMFYRNIAEKYVLKACVSPSAKQFMMNSVDISALNAASSIDFFDMRGKPFAAIKNDDMILVSVNYVGDDSLFASSDSILIYYDKERYEIWRKQFEKVYSTDICLEKYFVAAVSDKQEGFKRNSKILIFNKRGDVTAEYLLESGVKNINTFDDLISINTEREVFFINTKGRLVGKFISKADVLNVLFINKLEVVFVTRNCVIIGRIG